MKKILRSLQYILLALSGCALALSFWGNPQDAQKNQSFGGILLLVSLLQQGALLEMNQKTILKNQRVLSENQVMILGNQQKIAEAIGASMDLQIAVTTMNNPVETNYPEEISAPLF